MEQQINILKGSIYLTDDINVVYQFPIGPTGKIINLDEDELLPKDNNVIGGTCLLPPIAAKIAESDGDEQSYDNFYRDHLLESYQQEFIGALLAFLYKGGNLLIFLPDMGYTVTRDKLCGLIYQLYGIHIGIINDQINGNCYYDNTAIPIWLNLIYEARVISGYEYLTMYPIDAVLNNQKIMNLLLDELKPYDRTYEEKINHILQLHKQLHKNNKIIMPIRYII